MACSIVRCFYLVVFFFFFFFKQKTAYEMRISDWSSDVCSSDLRHLRRERAVVEKHVATVDPLDPQMASDQESGMAGAVDEQPGGDVAKFARADRGDAAPPVAQYVDDMVRDMAHAQRSEERSVG